MQQPGQPSLRILREGDMASGEPGYRQKGRGGGRHIGSRVQFTDTIM